LHNAFNSYITVYNTIYFGISSFTHCNMASNL
jgi:hypothetical protein